MAAVGRKNSGLAAFRNLSTRSTLKSEVTNDFALPISRDYWDEFATLNLAPIAMGREHFRVDIGVTIHGSKAVGDSLRIVCSWDIDRIVGWVGYSSNSRFLARRVRRQGLLAETAAERDFASYGTLTP